MEEIIRDDAGSISYHLNIDRGKLQPYIDDMVDGLALLPTPIDMSIKERFGQIEVRCWLHSEVDDVKISQLFRNVRSFLTYNPSTGEVLTMHDVLNILYYTVRELLNELNSWIKSGMIVQELRGCFTAYKLNKEKMWVTGEYK